MKKIRVVHILYSFQTGGMEKGIATIVRNASESFKHIILCISSSGETERLLPTGTPVIKLHKPPGNSPIFLLKFANRLKTLKPAIIHTRNWAGTDGIIAARLAGIQSVIHGEHGWEISDAEGINSRRLKIRRALSRWVQEYTCVSKHQKQWLREVVKVKASITQIYNGVDTQRFCPGEDGLKIRNELGIAEKTFLIGVVGRLDPIKDHLTLFRVFKELKETSPATCLLVVGDGPERSRLENAADDSIIFLGDRTDVPSILQALDVFVLPSLNEGISNTILEAMATGLPVIATNVGGNSELVEHGITGTLVPSKDVEAMTSALLTYKNYQELRESRGKQGRAKAVQSFSIENMVNSYETVYKRIASSIKD